MAGKIVNVTNVKEDEISDEIMSLFRRIDGLDTVIPVSYYSVLVAWPMFKNQGMTRHWT